MILNDIIICLTGYTALNNLTTGGIRHNTIDVNCDKTKNWITFTWTKKSSEDSSDMKDAVCHYELKVQCISQSDSTTVLMAETLNDHLSTYDDGKIRDLSLTGGEEIDYDLERQVWFKTNVYDILYTK